jgi:hypothetical protein
VTRPFKKWRTKTVKRLWIGVIFFSAVAAMLLLGVQTSNSQAKPAPATATVHLVITDEALVEEKELPPLQKEDVKVKQGKNFLQVRELIPARGDNAALQLIILIDDTLNPSVGNNLSDLKDFIAAQPPTTLIAVGYMSNTTVQIAQNFTADHDLAVKAVRLPRGSVSSMDSPYLSLISLVKGWSEQKVRREVLMVSDGVDRLHGERPQPSQLGPNYGGAYHRPEYVGAYQSSRYGAASRSGALNPNYSYNYDSMPTISVDAASASEVSQRYNVLVYSLYAAGVGRVGRSPWDLQLGLSGLSQIADETGAECFSLSTSQLVSFKPYLDKFQKYLANQYYVVFDAVPKKKAGFQRVNIQTELSNSEIEAPDNVWVPAAKE